MLHPLKPTLQTLRCGTLIGFKKEKMIRKNKQNHPSASSGPTSYVFVVCKHAPECLDSHVKSPTDRFHWNNVFEGEGRGSSLFASGNSIWDEVAQIYSIHETDNKMAASLKIIFVSMLLCPPPLPPLSLSISLFRSPVICSSASTHIVCQESNGTENMGLTNIQWRFEPLLCPWPWSWTRQSDLFHKTLELMMMYHLAT